MKLKTPLKTITIERSLSERIAQGSKHDIEELISKILSAIHGRKMCAHLLYFTVLTETYCYTEEM